MVASGASAGIALSIAGAGSAFAGYPGGSKVTYNTNSCTNPAVTTGPSDAAISLGSDESYAGIAVGVDTTTGVPLAGGITVGDAGPTGAGLTPTAGILQGSTTGKLHNLGADAFVSAAFLQAGVGLNLIHIGDNIPADVTITINAYGGATFNASQPSGVTVNSPTQVSVTGNGSGSVIGTVGPPAQVTQPLDMQIGFPEVAYSVPNDPSLNVYFAQDATAAAGSPTPYPAAGNRSALALAHLPGIGDLPLSCLPGVSAAAVPPATQGTWTPTPQSDVKVFAAVDVQPALPPTLVPQTLASVNKGGQGFLNTLAGATDNVPITSVQVVDQPLHGTVTIDNNSASPTFGRATYTNNGTGAGGGDSFTVTASSIGGTSAVTTETITTIIDHAPDCNASAPGPSCHIDQVVVVPVFGADLTMSQASGFPLDVLGRTVTASGCDGPAITLNGQPQLACGAMWPVTVENARGTDAEWELTGQVTDFLDSVAPQGTTCGTAATNNNHCIPGGNLSWIPVAGVGHGIVPGDVAQVSPGNAILNIGINAPSLANTAGLDNVTAGPFGNNAGAAIAAYSGMPGQTSVATQTNPVVVPDAAAGLHDSAQTLCSAAANHSGGTFICGAALVVAVPASAAQAPFNPRTGQGGYTAQLTLTLQ
jgi:hypothetical protein